MNAVATEPTQRDIDTTRPDRLADLVSPLGGLVSQVRQLPVQPSDPPLVVHSADLGDASTALPYLCDPSCVGRMDGTGTALDADRASIVAVAEALERYSNCVYDERQFRWSTAEALGTEALDLGSLPRCSPTELTDPACPVSPPDPTATMRWVRGLNLRTGELRWVPAMLVYLHIRPHGKGERYTTPISTGVALHPDPAVALSNALCEVVERDAISLTWLQQLPLPRIELDTVGPHLRRYLDVSADRDVTIHLFDATTDVGIPTVYAVAVAPDHPTCRTVVSCATSLDPQTAAAKAICETASERIALHGARPSNGDVRSFTSVFDGAVYMCAPERAAAFDFLLESPARRRLSEMPTLATGDPVGDLRVVRSLLDERGLDAYVMDLTTDEALRAGMTVVRAVIPGLQPLSFSYRARYLGHPRLYEAPVRMGYPARTETELNTWPQPFA